ncbi:PDZ domain-containing protein [Jejuia spongiicola]|uniref:Pectinesterase family protein n=1 Tax=Jejuia spongiicola TaxID=2942207 RepID=A0ABT0QGM7_9FLAO|nr:PDZ domain-containing protein [Jejuia spongiicola]MCL6296156.1 pectinesterase family protein [Jejuia spongiicola]
MRKYTSFIYFTIFIFMAACSKQQEQVINVVSDGNGDSISTFNTIEEALGKVEEMRNENINSPITINISEGVYRLNSAAKIKPAYGELKLIGAGVDKTIIKGSKTLQLKWEKYDDNIWVAQIPKNESFDQLYINGNQQILARYPNYNENGGHWQGHASDAISSDRVATWKNPKGAIIHAMHRGEWGGFHYLAEGVNDKGELILTKGHQNNRPSKMHDTYRMVENVFEELDSPKEWYLDSNNQLYYWPDAKADLNNATFEIVQQKHLIDIVGSEENPVKNISISGIKFEHTQRTLFEDYEPLLRSDWTIYRGGALFIEGTENVEIENCEFTNLGGNAIFVSAYNRDVSIKNNHIHDCGATAINFVGSPTAVRSPSFQYYEFVELTKLDTIKGPKNNNYPSVSKVDNNLIYRIGRIEKQTAGVNISMAMDITVSNNTIYDVPRAGINICDGTWGGHIIEQNDVFNTVLESGDHGAFNSWGRDRFWHPNRSILDSIVTMYPNMPKWDAIHQTIIRNNRFRCDHGWDIDLDDGSSNYKIYNNVCLNGGLKLREGFYRTVENNIMINNGFHPHVWFKKSEDIFRRNIVLTEHKDIRLQAWGKEVDFNLFPDQTALLKAQNNGVDTHSIFGNPNFKNPEQADYTVSENSPAFQIGFKNFKMNDFGVKNENLKALAKQPETPIIWSANASKKNLKVSWLGATLKNIETMAERSAAGLNETSGVLILDIEDNSIIAKSTLEKGDVIISAENDKTKVIADLMNVYQNNNWKGVLNLEIYRNQKSQKLKINLK